MFTREEKEILKCVLGHSDDDCFGCIFDRQDGCNLHNGEYGLATRDMYFESIKSKLIQSGLL